MNAPQQRVVVISADASIIASVQSALRAFQNCAVEPHLSAITAIEQSLQLPTGVILAVDVDATSRADLVALQGLMSRFGATNPVIVFTGTFDDAVGRWFLQIKITDFLRKPLDSKEVLTVFQRLLNAQDGIEKSAHITTFMPSAGGVGNTTLAVEAAIQFARANPANTACLVDLDFQNDACASYLDIEPRLDLVELGAQGERIDAQILETICSRHSSGLHLVAAPADPCHDIATSPEAIMRLLDVVAARFDQVVIDIPRMWFAWTGDILRGSDGIFIVTDMTVPGLRCARRLAQRIGALQNCESAPKVIVNRLEKQTIFGGGLRRADIEHALEGYFGGAVANNYPLVREAIDRGMPVSMVKDGNNVSGDLRKIIFA